MSKNTQSSQWKIIYPASWGHNGTYHISVFQDEESLYRAVRSSTVQDFEDAQEDGEDFGEMVSNFFKNLAKVGSYQDAQNILAVYDSLDFDGKQHIILGNPQKITF